MRHQTEPKNGGQWIRYLVMAAIALFLFGFRLNADPVTVRHIQGYLHGFLVLKDTNEKILASGGLTQIPGGNHVTTTLTLNFRDGSLYQETAVFSQRRIFQLLTYKQVMKGPAFKASETLTLEASTGDVNVQYTDKDGKEKTISDKLSLPSDLANGILSMLLTDADPEVETTLSMLVSTPKPRIVKLKISASGEDSFSVDGFVGKAKHYTVNIDIGGITGVAAKVVGKQPPPVQMWIAAGDAPVFLKSEGALFEDGPIWRIELSSPTWPKAQK